MGGVARSACSVVPLFRVSDTSYAAPPMATARRGLSDVAEAQACQQELLRIDRVAVDARLIVQMRPGRAAGRADLADGLTHSDLLADLHVDFGQMAVARRKAVAVVDFDQIAVAA